MVEFLETAKLLAEQYKLKGYMPSYVNLYTKWWASLTSGSTDYIIGNLIENRHGFFKVYSVILYAWENVSPN